MAGSKTAILAIRIISDAKGAQQGLDDTAKASGRFSSAMGTAKVAAAGVLGGLALIGKQAFDSASRLQQAAGAVESVYAAQSSAVDKLAAGAANRLGLATSQYSEFASVLGAQLKNLGFPTDQLVEKQDSLQQMGADLAATFGGTTSDAVDALSSALRGERDPIERYGISLSQSAIDAKVAAMGLDTSTDAAKKNATAVATLALLTSQSADAHGAFAREADTAAGAQQRATANWENAKATLGEKLLPVVSEIATKLSELATFISDNSGAFTILAGVLAGLAFAVYAVNGAIAAYRAIVMIATAMQWLWNAAMFANPIGLIVLAIAAVVAVAILMYQHFEWFRDLVAAIGRFFARVFDPFLSAIRNLWDAVSNAGSAWDVFKALAITAINIIMAPLRTLWNIIKEIGKGIGAAAKWVGGLFSAPAPAPTPATVSASRYAAVGAGELSATGNLRAGAMLAGVAAPVAPSSSSSTPTLSTGPSVVINVSGAIDPLETARQIRRLLLDDDRMSGRGVAVQVSQR